MTEGTRHRSQIFQLRPNKVQASYFAQAVGVSRFAYNWALAQWKEKATEWWETNGATPFPSAFSLQKEFNAIKRANWPWMDNVAQLIPERSIASVGVAYARYKKGIAKYPKFKSKHRSKENFFGAVRKVEARIKGKRLKLPKIGWLRLSRLPRWEGEITQVVIQRRAGKWYAVVSFALRDEPKQPRPAVAAGVDIGVKYPLTVTCGDAVHNYGAGLRERLNVERRKLRKADRRMRRRIPGSRRRLKAQIAVAKINRKISDIRSDVQHKATSSIARMADVIGIEDLNVRGLLRNRAVSRAIQDVGFRAIRDQLSYKANSLVTAGRFYPSSKSCSCCGAVKPSLPLSERRYNCGHCGLSIDRDENAARNLEKLAADEAVSLRGERSSDPERQLVFRSLSEKRGPTKVGSFD